jgi:23S rRNA G2069 N7-methylase RlmK/C1962 C5-methylase RlmI
MAIPWEPSQRRAVYEVLQRYPASSGRCHEAAAQILPVAREYDGDARILRIIPSSKLPRARFVIPRIKPAEPWRRWYEHHTTEAVLHFVDSLTGVDGTAVDAYLKKHWDYPEDLEIQPL